jgi:RNA polymerase sigma factor (TIGR02999 family)
MTAALFFARERNKAAFCKRLRLRCNGARVMTHASAGVMVTGSPVDLSRSAQASERLFSMAYEELRRIAHQQRRRVGAPHTLNTTALVHEVYLKLSSGSHEQELERAHFLALAARAMRQVLIDHARSRVCLKRGGEIVFTEADENQADCSSDMADMLALDQSLTELSELDARAGQVVELYVFGGLRIEEIARIQGHTERTTYRDWRRARAFLVQHLGLIPADSES